VLVISHSVAGGKKISTGEGRERDRCRPTYTSKTEECVDKELRAEFSTLMDEIVEEQIGLKEGHVRIVKL